MRGRLTRALQESRRRRRKSPGTGTFDTPEETWNAMRAEYIHGSETLKDIAQRHGVLYSAAHRVSNDERWYKLVPHSLGRPAAIAPHLRVIDGGQPPE